MLGLESFLVRQKVRLESELRVLRELNDEDGIMLLEWMEENWIWRKEGERAEAAAREQGGGRRSVPWFWKIQFDIWGDDIDSIKGAVRNGTTDGRNSRHICWQFTNILHSYQRPVKKGLKKK